MKVQIVVQGHHSYFRKDNLQLHGHHSYFRKDFQMLLARKRGEIEPPNRALGQIYQQQTKTNLKIEKKIPSKACDCDLKMRFPQIAGNFARTCTT